MTEGLFLITTLFVAYVVYVIVNEKKTESDAKKSAVTVKKTESVAVAVEKPKPAVKVKAEPAKTTAAKAPVFAKSAVAPKPAAKAAVSTKPVATPKAVATKPAAVIKEEEAPSAAQAPKSSGLKDPISGEIVTTYSNYRFTKRWIKEALVAEGLVEKVYKNDELNAAVEAKIKEAIAKLEGNKKYQP